MPVTATLTVTSSADTGLIEALGADVKMKNYEVLSFCQYYS